MECTVGAEVVAPADGLKVIVSLVQRFVPRVCVICQVGSKVGYVVCEELVGSAVNEELINKELGCTVGAEVVGPANALKTLHHLLSGLLQQCVLDVRLGQKLALEFVQKFFDLHSVQNMLNKKWNAQLVHKLLDQQMV